MCRSLVGSVPAGAGNQARVAGPDATLRASALGTARVLSRHAPRRPTARPLTAAALAEADAVLALTGHSTVDYGFVVQHSKLVVGTRNATKGVAHGRRRSWRRELGQAAQLTWRRIG